MGRISKAMRKANTSKEALGSHGFKLPPKIEPAPARSWMENYSYWETLAVRYRDREDGERIATQKAKASGERRGEAEQRRQDRLAKQREYQTGVEPVPSWAREQECHLDMDQRGACGEGKQMSWEIWDVIYPVLRPSTQDRPLKLKDQTFRSKHLAWVTCQKCLVKLDEMLANGTVRVVKERRRLVIEILK